MPDSVLRTKLQRPTTVGEFVCRTRLHALLDAGLAGPLTLVAAPAGYGKTTLVSHWLQGRTEHSAWLSLEESDADPLALLRCMTAAVRMAWPAACPETHDLLLVPDPPPVSVLVRSLINELDAIPERLILVLDDYHELRDSQTHEVIHALLQHTPHNLHVLICTRRDPPVNLAVLRAGNRLTELRLADLAFTQAETESFLAQALGHSVGNQAVANAHRQFEGWAAGLRLAALAVRGRECPAEFLANLHGDLQDVRDYLLEEVVGRQPVALQNWLKKTAVLDRFNARLCEHVCAGGEDSSIDGDAFLRRLEGENLFAIAVDPAREWYRLHALFRELLQRQLMRSVGPAGMAELHKRASAWFAAEGLVEEAVKHALAAGEPLAAAELVETARYRVLKDGQWHLLERWLKLLPAELIQSRPELLTARLWQHDTQADYTAIPGTLAAVETALGDEPRSPIVEGEVQFLKGLCRFFEVGDTGSFAHLEKALALIPESFVGAHNSIVSYHALAAQMAGRLRPVARQLRSRLQSPTALSALHSLAFIHLVELDLAVALRYAERLQAAARDANHPRYEAWGRYWAAWVHYLRNELEEVCRLSEPNVRQPLVLNKGMAMDSHVLRALCFQGLGDVDQAQQTLAAMERFAGQSGNPAHFGIAQSCQARLALLQGDPARARQAIEHVDGDEEGRIMAFWAEVPRITACRVRLASGTSTDAEAVLQTLQRYARENRSVHNRLQLLEVLVLQALACDQVGNERGALDALGEAVEIARPGGVVWPFIEAGPQIVSLLRHLGREAEDEFVRDLIAACETGQGPAPGGAVPEGPDQSSREMKVALLAPLTGREQDVLELLSQRLQDREIAARLFVSPSTVNYHLKNIYAKLQVHSRREAIAKLRRQDVDQRLSAP